MLLLGIDFETTWTEPVDPMSARPLEVGAVLLDTTTWKPIRIYSQLIHDPDHPVMGQKLVDLVGFDDDIKAEHGIAPLKAFNALNFLMEKADYFCAHNGRDFDKIVYEMECDRLGIEPVVRSWLDTKKDILFPEHIKTTRLTHLAAEHGFVNPFAHRALFDVLTMFKVLENYNVLEFRDRALQPEIKLLADVSYEDRNKAKNKGFFWDKEEKEWTKIVKAGDVETLLPKLGFKVRQIPLQKS